jgi:hypothetical protein
MQGLDKTLHIVGTQANWDVMQLFSVHVHEGYDRANNL